jgi:hypothetical protein
MAGWMCTLVAQEQLLFFFFCTTEFINHRSAPGESEHSRLKNKVSSNEPENIKWEFSQKQL